RRRSVRKLRLQAAEVILADRRGVALLGATHPQLIELERVVERRRAARHRTEARDEAPRGGAGDLAPVRGELSLQLRKPRDQVPGTMTPSGGRQGRAVKSRFFTRALGD